MYLACTLKVNARAASKYICVKQAKAKMGGQRARDEKRNQQKGCTVNLS